MVLFPIIIDDDQDFYFNIILKRGLERLDYIIEGIRLEKDMGTR